MCTLFITQSRNSAHLGSTRILSATNLRVPSFSPALYLSLPCCLLLRQPMPLATFDTVVSIGELLDRVRACIDDVSPDTIVSLTIDVASGGERRVLRLAVKPVDNLAPLSTSPFQTSSCTSPSEHSTAPLCVDTAMMEEDSEVGGHNKSDQQQEQEELVEMEREMKEEDQQARANVIVEDALASSTTSSVESFERSSSSLSTVVGENAGTSPSIPLPTDENIRRSARKQSPVDRLVYGASMPRETERTTSKRKRQQAQAEAATAADTTDGQSDSSEESDAAWGSSSSSSSSPAAASSTWSSPPKHRKKCRYQHTARENDKEEEEEGEEEEQVTALMKKFEEAYAARDDVSLEQTSKEAVLNLGRDVMHGLSDAGSTVLLDSAGYQQCAVKLDRLIATSSAVRMLGYYLKGALAAKLKLSCRTKYVHAARTLLRLKSSADISACPAFYGFVQQHCPNVASGVVDVEAWLKEPILLANIGWGEWRRYLSKRHCWIVSSAMERFKASLVPAKDWMQRGWVEEYSDDRLGRGVRATRDIPLPSARGRHRSFGDSVVADLNIFAQAQALVALDSQQQQQQAQQSDGGDRSSPSPSASPSTSPYRFEWNRGKQMLNAEKLWVGKTNHLPEKHCNLRLSSNGKLLQIKPIRAGEALTFDYSMSYWVERVTGITWKQWMATGTVACRKGCAELFERMHRSVLDYTSLLSQQWSERFAGAASEVDKELVMMELWRELVPEEERRMEEDDA